MSQNSDKQTKHKSRWKHKVNAFDNDRWMAIQTQRNCLKLVRCRTYPEDTLAQTDWQSRQADRQLRCSNNHCVYTSGPLEINKRGCVCSLCWGNCTIGKRILNFIRRFRMFPLICLHPSASLSVSLGVSVCLFVCFSLLLFLFSIVILAIYSVATSSRPLLHSTPIFFNVNV